MGAGGRSSSGGGASKKRRALLSEAERALWRQAMHDVAPLKSRRSGSRRRLEETPLPAVEGSDQASTGQASTGSSENTLPQPPVPAPQPRAPLQPFVIGSLAGPRAASSKRTETQPFSDFRAAAAEGKRAQPVGLDRRSAERLRRGQMEIEARLDLHGMTQAAAQPALEAFLASAQRQGLRCLLVITGKGSSGGEAGVLRRRVPRWLAEAPNRGRVLAVAPARSQHGGGGALYVLLRRLRDT